MQELSLVYNLYGEELLQGEKWQNVRANFRGADPFETTLYRVIKEERGFLFFHPLKGGLNGYHETLKELVINALLNSNIQVFILE